MSALCAALDLQNCALEGKESCQWEYFTRFSLESLPWHLLFEEHLGRPLSILHERHPLTILMRVERLLNLFQPSLEHARATCSRPMMLMFCNYGLTSSLSFCIYSTKEKNSQGTIISQCGKMDNSLHPITFTVANFLVCR